jgi:hypothetical protein
MNMVTVKSGPQDLSVDGRVILLDLKEISWQGMDWINLAQDRDKWQALVNKVMNLWVP